MFNHRDGLLKSCPKCNWHDWKIGTAKTISGSIIHPYFCGNCGEKTQLYEKKDVAKRVGCSSKIEIEIKNHRICSVCSSAGAEEHHWAPYFIFGSEADLWPKSMLCIKCHKRWHSLVTPNMCKKL